MKIGNYLSEYDYVRDISTFTIYAICNKKNGVVKYVGKTNNLAVRLRTLLKDPGHCSRKVSSWMSNHMNKHDNLNVYILEDDIEEGLVMKREKYWINRYDDGSLLNTHLYKLSVT